MTFNDRFRRLVHAACPSAIPGYWRHVRPRPAAIALLGVLAAGLLTACSMSDGVGSFIVDPGHYSVYHCKDMVTRLNELLDKEKQLRELMDAASEGGGGSVIGTLSYRPNYEKAVGEEKILRRTAAQKNCELPPPALPTSPAPAPANASTPYQSDQMIR